MKKAKHFGIKELVSRACYEKVGESAWQFFDGKAIDTLDWFREKIGLPITVNDWAWGGQYQHRGFRWDDCAIGASKSAHKEGKAFDFSVKGMTDNEVKDWIEENESELPYRIRIEEEDTNAKVHFDTRRLDTDAEKIKYFRP